MEIALPRFDYGTGDPSTSLRARCLSAQREALLIPDDMAVEECVFSGEETERILALLEGIPSWN